MTNEQRSGIRESQGERDRQPDDPGGVHATAPDTRPALFTTVARNRTGAAGESAIEGGLRVPVRSPLEPGRAPASGGPVVSEPDATNPEELLALAWATCLNASARAVAGSGREVDVSVRVDLVRAAAGTGYEFRPHAELRFEGASGAEAERLARAAHDRCPVSKLLSGRSAVTISIAPWAAATPGG